MMLIAKVCGKWQPFGENYLAQLPRISETLVKTISGNATHLKVVEILYNAYYKGEGQECNGCVRY